MAIIETSGPALAAHPADDRSYLDWAPVIAGALLAAAVSFVLLTFGSAVGLSLTSAYEGSGISLAAFSIAAALWLLWVQISSFFAGGYLAGRMRRRHGDASEHESDIRDGSHGLTVWALGVLLGAFIAVSGISGAVSTATSAIGAAAGTTAAAATAAVADVDPSMLLTDRLMRPAAQPAASAPASPSAGQAGADMDVRSELGRVLMASLDGELSAEDRAYVTATIAAQTGISQEEAEQRVSQFVEQARQLEADARSAADRARRLAMLVAFMTAASLLISGAAAYYGATLGGNHRDKQTVFSEWNRFS